jgi:hypothetical protein
MVFKIITLFSIPIPKANASISGKPKSYFLPSPTLILTVCFYPSQYRNISLICESILDTAPGLGILWRPGILALELEEWPPKESAFILNSSSLIRETEVMSSLSIMG